MRGKFRPIAHQALSLRKFAPWVHRRQGVAGCERDDFIRSAIKKRIGHDEQRIDVLLRKNCECCVELTVVAGIDHRNLLTRGARSRLHHSDIGLSARVLWVARKPTSLAVGTTSCRSCSCFGSSVLVMTAKPVTLPVGRLRLLTTPY